jgi:hypothetical protein
VKLIKNQGKHREETIKSQAEHDRKKDKFLPSHLLSNWFTDIKVDFD